MRAGDFPNGYIRGSACLNMAMITILHALNFTVMRPLPLQRAGGAQFQSQGLEALLNLLRQFLVIFDCPFAEAHLPFHLPIKYHFLRRKTRGAVFPETRRQLRKNDECEGKFGGGPFPKVPHKRPVERIEKRPGQLTMVYRHVLAADAID